MDPLGRFFFDTVDVNFTESSPIHVYAITSDLSFPEVEGSPFVPGVLPAAIDPTGKFIFGFDATGIVTLQIGSTGTLTASSTLPVSCNPQNASLWAYVDANGRFLYVQVPTLFGYDLHVFQIDATGALTATASETSFSPGGADSTFSFIAFNPAGSLVFSSDCNPLCRLDTLSIDSKTGYVNPTPVSAVSQTWGAAALDRAGQHLFAVAGVAREGSSCNAADAPAGTLTVHAVSPTGQIRPGQTVSTGPCPIGVASMP